MIERRELLMAGAGLVQSATFLAIILGQILGLKVALLEGGAIKELESNHVSNFISYLDAGGLDFDQVSSSLRLFAEKVIPNFR